MKRKTIDWSDEPRALNLWGPPPSPEVLEAGIPVLAPRGTHAPSA